VRNMSFALTESQLLDGSKTVTRRKGWRVLKVGDQLSAVRKAMGLKPGEKLHRLAVLEVVSVRREPLEAITADDCAREGFPRMSAAEFVEFFRRHMGGGTDQEVTRIEFKRLEGGAP
jgi:hypothetical protein